MNHRILFISAVVIPLLVACSNSSGNSFAIRDFSQSLQPYLRKAVEQGIVGYDSNTKFIERNATDKELEKLSQSEHPVLRAVALREMLERPGFDHFHLIMNHLSDTAIVAVNEGEWGIVHHRVSDEMLHNGKWTDTAALNTTIREIILHHSYLNSAFDKIGHVELNETYYPIIKKMLNRERNFYDQFEHYEKALYVLASYKKPEDIPFIKQMLSDNILWLSFHSFSLMRDYPDDSYLDIYEKYSRRIFYRNICKGFYFDSEIFFNSVASYQNERSAKILSFILNRKPFMPCINESRDIKRNLVLAIWNNPCKAYSKIRNQIRQDAKKYIVEIRKSEAMELSIEIDNTFFKKDTSPEPVRWW